nr:hypothetical protein [Mycolicibacterium malmesburyense]CRL73390.1 hypothetical protein CPGR_02710 [Mycolicibacterium malmesburyense]
MAEHESGQWNVAAKDDMVYLERVNDSGELLFGDSLEPHEARQLARALTKFADKLDESPSRERKEAAGSDSDDKEDSPDDDDEDSPDDSLDDSPDEDEDDKSDESSS